MKKDKLLILYSKYPELGKSKTRIARSIGDDNALKFCFACISDTIRKMKSFDDVDLLVVPNSKVEGFAFENRFSMSSISLEELRINPRLGSSEIFQNLFDHFLKSYNKVVLIPMDVPHIDKSVIEEAFEKLTNHSEVFGPEENGGVYLIGLKELQSSLFDDVRWSTPNSFNDLVNNSNCPFVLDLSFDLNEFLDLFKLNAELLLSCPGLTRFIKSLMLQLVPQKEVAYERN